MPALILHMTLARQMLERDDLPPELLAACRRAPGFLLLGSVLPDLPYHAHFGGQLARHLLKREYLHSEWGDVFHGRRTGRFALSLLAHLLRSHPTEEQPQQLLALAAGYLSHHAADRRGHPPIQRLVALHRRAPEPHIVAHARFERYQDLLYHRDLLGYEISGSPFPARLISEMAGAGLLFARLPGVLWEALRSACLETHGHTPRPAEVRDWLWGTTAYGAVLSSPLGRIERLTGDLDDLRRQWYQGPEVDLVTPLQRAQALTAEYWRAAAQLVRAGRLTAERRETFLRLVPDIDLSTGA